MGMNGHVVSSYRQSLVCMCTLPEVLLEKETCLSSMMLTNEHFKIMNLWISNIYIYIGVISVNRYIYQYCKQACAMKTWSILGFIEVWNQDYSHGYGQRLRKNMRGISLRQIQNYIGKELFISLMKMYISKVYSKYSSYEYKARGYVWDTEVVVFFGLNYQLVNR